MLRIPNTGLIIAFVLIMVVLIVNATVTYKNLVDLQAQSGRVRHTHEVIEALYEARAAIKDAETGQRGFLITGKESYLEPYTGGVASVEATMAKLTSVVADQPSLAARLPALDLLIRSELSELAHAIELRRVSGFDRAQDQVLSDVSKRDMDAIQTMFAAMLEEGEASLRASSKEDEATFKAALLSALITAVVSILLFSTAVLLIRRNIAARTSATDALAEQGDLLRTTLATIVEGIFVTDAEGQLTFVNPAAEVMSGHALDDAVGRPIASILDVRDSKTDAPVANTALEAIRTGAVESKSTLRILVTPDGRRRAIEEFAAPLRNIEGRILGAVLTMRDVSDQRRDEIRIAGARAYAESIVDTVGDPLVILDREARVRSANLAFFALFGASEVNTVGQPIFALAGVRWNARVVRALLDEAEARSTGEDSVELDCTFTEGKKHILRLNARRLRGEGEHAHLILLAIRDITERRENERRVKQLLEAEQENASRLREIASAAMTLNSAHSRERVLEVLRDEARRILESESATVTLDSAAPVVSEAALIAPLVGRDGQALGWVRLHGVATRGGSSRENDESMLRQLAHVASVAIENARLYEELREGDRHKNEFLATLAHELRNPLAPVRNSVQVLRAPELTPAMRDQAVATIERQVSLLVRLVDDLLDVSRITRGKIALKTELVDLAEIVGRALEISRPIVEASGHRLSVELPSRRTLLFVDTSRIAQVLANLLNNAAKYTDRGGHMRLSCTVVGEEVVISVRDDGMGIPPEVLPHIFTMFWQVGHALERAQGGLGIGLTLVKQLVDLHGGRVEARSAGVGRGSEFIVRLPLADAESMPVATIAPLDATKAAQSPSVRRILVVDDNVDSAESLALLLGLQGHAVHTAHDGEEALTAVATHQPELVLLDIGLPRLDGHEVARILRTRHGRSVMLVAMTGFGRAEDRTRSLEAGFDHHLVKPVDPALLTAILLEIDAAAS